MAIGEISGQYRYTGKGPVDAKQLVKTYNDLLLESTWASTSGSNTAYNGMIVAVWLDKNADKSLSDRNGIYFLFDPNCNSTLKKPEVSNEANWHKIAEVGNLPDRLAEIDARLTALEEKETDDSVITYGYRKDFPTEGQSGIMYIAIDEKKTYVWFNNEYLSVGGSDYEEPELIFGGDSGI
jgi:hypothetical protein